MDYTKDEELMKMLSDLTKEVEGWNYSINSHWINDERLIESRRNTLNEVIFKFKIHINSK